MSLVIKTLTSLIRSRNSFQCLAGHRANATGRNSVSEVTDSLVDISSPHTTATEVRVPLGDMDRNRSYALCRRVIHLNCFTKCFVKSIF